MAEVTVDRATETLTEALRMADMGWPVFPIHSLAKRGGCTCREKKKCDRVAKHPRTKNGLKDATTDKNVIKAWWAEWPDANLGVRTGNGLVVLDVDEHKFGDETLAALEDLHGALPETMAVNTGGGGQHYYFTTDKKVQNSVEALGPGLDTRGEGGYVVAPPSMHASGTPYGWDLGGHPLAIMPNWVIPPAKAAYKTPEAIAGATIIGEKRNNYLTSYGGKMRRDGASEMVLRATLMAENMQRCRPPLDDKEVCRIAKSVSRYPTVVAQNVEDDSKPEWWSLLTLSGKNKDRIKRSPGNASVLLCHRDEWQGVLRYDEFSDAVQWTKDAPDGGGPGRPLVGRDLIEVDHGYVGHWLARYAGTDFSAQAIANGIETSARQNIVHPVREYLEELQWDGTERLGDWLHTYLGATRTPYTQSVGQWWLISAVARVMNPGCQADHMLVLEGPQGIGKSSAVRILAGDWHLGSLPDLRTKDSGHALQGRWIVEVGELDAFRGVGTTRVKDYISQVYDSYRPAYARLFVNRPRQCVFIATTNENSYLDDATGGRRYWPVKTIWLKRAELARDRDQIWAEAMVSLRGGAQWHPTVEMTQEITKQQEDRNRVDPWEEKITSWLINKTETRSLDLLVNGIGMETARIEHRHYMRIAAIMRQIGWITKRYKVNGARTTVFHHPKNSLEL